MIKLFATDMDHTLLNDQSQLPNDFEHTLTVLKAHNIPLVLASGRSLLSMKAKVASIPYSFTFISDNGALIEKDGSFINTSLVNNSDVAYLLSVLRQCDGISISATGIHNAYIEVLNPQHREYFQEYYPGFETVDDISRLNEEIVKLTVLRLEGNESIFENTISPLINGVSDYTAVKSGSVWVDIMRKGVNKGNALATLIKTLNIDAENVAAFGDYHNDIEMLQLAHYSFAMENAHDDVKAAAKKIIGTNNDGAVTQTILHYLDK